MALIKCLECSKEFSDKAIQCPECACPNETFKEPEPEKPVLKPVVNHRPGSNDSNDSNDYESSQTNDIQEVYKSFKLYVNKLPDREYEEINFKLGLVGGIMAIVGVFCPVFKVIFLGDISLMNISDIADSGFMTFLVYLIIALGVFGIICSNKKLYHMNLIFGVLSICLYLFLYFGSKNQAQGAEGMVRLSWGWVVLISSSICLILSKTYKSKNYKESEQN